MKKTILLLAIVATIVACGKKTEKENDDSQKEVSNNQYSVIVDAVVEKNDTCLVMVYDDNNFEVMNQRVKMPVTGSLNPQKIVFNLQQGTTPVNLGIAFSTNKEQKQIKLNTVSIKNKEKLLFNPTDFLYYFKNNDQLIMNTATSIHELKHDKEYPPSFVGNDKLIGTIAGANEK